jgi:glycosyltransferase involved in cell wall biosynthesis
MTIDARKRLIEEKNIKLSFIVPAYNEGLNISTFLQHAVNKLPTLSPHYEILFIDDGSNDDTLLYMQKAAKENNHLKILSFSRNFGKETAITAGLEHCNGDIAIIMDADLQHPFETIETFLQQWVAGFDMVYAVCTTRTDQSLLRRLFSNLFYRLINTLSATKIPANAGDFRLLDRKVINAINQCGEYDRFMKGLYAWVGFQSIAVPYTPKQRHDGTSTFSLSGLLKLAITGIISFSDIPLRIWGIIGITISVFSLIYAFLIALDTIIFGADVPGFTTLAVAIMFLGGIQLMSIGILGEYISRIFREVKQRPKYIVASQYGFDKNNGTEDFNAPSS